MSEYGTYVDLLRIIGAVIAGVGLFLYGLEQFTLEVTRVSGERTQRVFAQLTASRLRGVLTGAVSTAIVQSSTSVSVVVLSLVESGVLTFVKSIPVILGANIGTTITSQLVALRAIDWGTYMLALGFLVSLLPGKAKHAGRVIFTFGFVFFGLNVVAAALEPLAHLDAAMSVLRRLDDPYSFVLVGMVLTAIIQSSSVTTGLAVVLVQSHVLSFEAGLGIVMGSNAGTCATTWIASRGMSKAAKRTAWAHIGFNVVGVLIFLPVVRWFAELLHLFPGSEAMQLAHGHLIFNVVTVVIVLVLFTPFRRVLERWIPDDAPVVVR